MNFTRCLGRVGACRRAVVRTNVRRVDAMLAHAAEQCTAFAFPTLRWIRCASQRPGDKRRPYQGNCASWVMAFLVCISCSLAAEPVTLHWLGDAAPGAADGVSWGVPWPKGAVQPSTPMRLTTSTGASIDLQSWPVAFWPDGSVKWSGHAIAATPEISGPLTLSPATAPPTRSTEIKYDEDADSFTIDTGVFRARISKKSSAIISSLSIGTRAVAENGTLVGIR